MAPFSAPLPWWVSQPELSTHLGSGGRTDVRRGEDLVATVESGRVLVGVPVATRADAQALLAVVRQVTDGGPTLLDTGDSLLRYEARRAGFGGGLREPLRSGMAPPAASILSRTHSKSRHELLGELVQALVPGIGVSAQLRRGLLRRAVSGHEAMIELTVTVPDGGRLLVACPDLPDLVPENIALAIDTLARIRSRFRIAPGVLGRLSFDHSDFWAKTSKTAGSAHRNLGVIHMNASLVSADGLVVLARKQATPATWIDSVASHEAWHQMEGAFEARAYSQSIEFRRKVGEHFGVATLEHAVLGGRPGTEAAWRAAHEQLVREVSPYAGTATIEATAELFAMWWCSPVEAMSPAARHFGEVLTTIDLFSR